MPFIGNQPALSYTSFAKQDFTTSATTSYTLDNPVANENEIALFINFVRQEPTSAYTASGTSLTLTSATSASDDMYCVYLGKAVQTVNPPNGSVGISQLSATGTKDSTTFLRGDNTFAEAGGGEWTKLLHTTASADTTVAFDSTYITSTYQDYKVVFSNIHASEDQKFFNLYLSTDNGSSDTNVDSANRLFKDDENVSSRGQTNSANFRLHGNEYVGNDVGETISGFIEIFDPSATDTRTHILGRSIANIGDAANAHYSSLLGASTLTTTAVNYIKFGWTSGNIASGEFTLYGRKI